MFLVDRCTQRLLREAISQHSNYIIRELWHLIHTSQSSPVNTNNTNNANNNREVILPPHLTSALETLHIPTSLTTPFNKEKSRSTLDNWSTVLSYSQDPNDSSNSRTSGLSALLHSEKYAGLVD